MCIRCCGELPNTGMLPGFFAPGIESGASSIRPLDDLSEQLVDQGQQADRPTVGNVIHVSLLVQQGGSAGLPLKWKLASRGRAEEPRQSVHEH